MHAQYSSKSWYSCVVSSYSGFHNHTCRYQLLWSLIDDFLRICNILISNIWFQSVKFHLCSEPRPCHLAAAVVLVPVQVPEVLFFSTMLHKTNTNHHYNLNTWLCTQIIYLFIGECTVSESYANLPNNDCCNDEDNRTSSKPSKEYSHKCSCIWCQWFHHFL